MSTMFKLVGIQTCKIKFASFKSCKKHALTETSCVSPAVLSIMELDADADQPATVLWWDGCWMPVRLEMIRMEQTCAGLHVAQQPSW